MMKQTERKSVVKGMIIDTKNQSFEQFEVETAYTRSTEKAVKLANEILNPEKRPEIVITVSEIVNEKAERKIYDNAKLYANNEGMFIDENEAAEYAIENTLNVIRGTVYNYETNVFFYNIKSKEYGVKHFDWLCGESFTAIDARAMLAMRFEGIYENCKVRAIDMFENQRGYTKAEDTVYYAVTDKQMEKAVKVAKK